MKDNYDHLKNKPINQIIFPGTHDSGAYTVNFKKSMKSYLRLLKLLKTSTKDWTKTQDFNIFDQLSKGIRVFDLRLSYREKDNAFYITHTLTCTSLKDIIEQVTSFTENHPDEIIILLLKADWSYRQSLTVEKRMEALKLIKNKLNLIKNTNDFTTYKTLLKEKARIYLFFEGINDDYVWQHNRVVDPWIDTEKVNDKYEFLIEKYQNMQKNSTNFNILSFTITPQKNTIIKDIRNRLLKPCWYKKKSIKTMTSAIQNKIYEFTLKYKCNKLACFTTDFPTPTFITHIINLNLI